MLGNLPEYFQLSVRGIGLGDGSFVLFTLCAIYLWLAWFLLLLLKSADIKSKVSNNVADQLVATFNRIGLLTGPMLSTIACGF